MMSVSDAVAQRQSIRDFLPNSVARHDLLDLIERASRAPSGINAQPWQVSVLVGDQLNELSSKTLAAAEANPVGEDPPFQIYPNPMPKDVQLRYLRLGQQMYEAMGIGREDKIARAKAMRANWQFFGAPAGLIVTLRPELSDRNQWSYVGMFLQTFALLCVERGLGTCMQEAWAQYHRTVKSALGIPTDSIVVCGIAVGYPDMDSRANRFRTERRQLEDYVHHGA